MLVVLIIVGFVISYILKFFGYHPDCNKGIQIHIGVIRQLSIAESNSPNNSKIVLIKPGDNVESLSFSANVNLSKYINQKVIITGIYNSCTVSLAVNDPNAVQLFRE